jgi:uncharacterized RDD family membrane protein YckC
VSTNLSQLITEPSWKQEVNRRLAAHKSRKGLSVAPPEPAVNRAGVTSRAAQAAAAVAARYAKAPSYSQMQAEEARTAVRAAEIATQVALQAQANAHAVLADMHAASAFDVESAPMPPARISSSQIAAQTAAQVPERRDDWNWSPAKPVSSPFAEQPSIAEAEPAPEPILAPLPLIQERFDRHSLGVRWEPDMPASLGEQGTARTAQWMENRSEPFEISPQDWWEPASSLSVQMGGPAAESLEPVEPEQPIHANLIQFPSELVATRKVRPRLAEILAGGDDSLPGQLSIFEVDPCAISTEPERPDSPVTAAGPEWAGLELEAASPALDDLDLGMEPETVQSVPALHQAPMSRRLLAAVVDGSLIAGVFLAFAAFAISNLGELPGLRELEIWAASGFVLAGVLYLAVFTLLAECTPGMSYAGTSLCTFDDQVPTLAQRCGRLCGLLLSVLPLGLGVAWSLFDEDRMSWHDRLSRTYQRKS